MLLNCPRSRSQTPMSREPGDDRLGEPVNGLGAGGGCRARAAVNMAKRRRRTTPWTSPSMTC